jgi:arylsulfatase A-like enzyme
MPDKPFFVKYAPGATHAPHHPTEEWVKKIHDMHLFDEGYNKLREQIFENQKKLGRSADRGEDQSPSARRQGRDHHLGLAA